MTTEKKKDIHDPMDVFPVLEGWGSDLVNPKKMKTELVSKHKQNKEKRSENLTVIKTR